MGRSARRRWEVRRRARIPLIEQKGTKRSLLCEGGGVPVGLEIAGANVNDFKLLRATLEQILIDRPDASEAAPPGLCLDNGYDYRAV
jgi:hypothetical protein